MTEIPIRPDALEKLEAQFEPLAPWMHCFKFHDSAYVGYYKIQGRNLNETYCHRASDAGRIDLLRTAYQKSNIAYPRRWFASLCDHLELSDLSQSSLLDISSATGEKSFWFAKLGFGKVVSTEIRRNQHLQHQAILDSTSDQDYSRITAVHDAVSADHPDFPERYEKFDVVCSFGLLYHLSNPYQHILNLYQLSKRYVLLETFTHQDHNAMDYWAFLPEDQSVITKAISSISWRPHYLAVRKIARLAGFRRVEILYPDCFSVNFPDFESGDFPRNERCREGLLRKLGVKTDYHCRMSAFRKNYDPTYYEPTGMNPNYFYYILEK
ncbi:MAG: methyltransferase domain-containing protein [Alphaproteobacteria bacterium]|nr:methyltransferase domain-containing protein [Alphaproteobacteria bacterium]